MNMESIISTKRNKDIKNILFNIGIIVYVCFLFFLHFIRIFDQNFWGDEAFTINTIKTGLVEMIHITAADVHPPLYYIIAKVFCEILGYNGAIYHMVSIVPYGIMLILGVTVISKWFGKETALLFVSFASWLSTSIQMTVEVRMYSWGALFVLVSFLCLYKILVENKMIYWCIFVISSLSAAYTHYYCLISVAFFYVVLIIDAIFRKKENIKKTVWTCVITVLCYLPWFFVLLESFQRSTDEFWQNNVEKIEVCLEYIFSSNLSVIFFCIFIIVTIIWFVLEVKEKKNRETVIWVFSGIFALFGTLIVGIVVSVLIRPLFIARYLFPVSVVAWLVIGIAISRFKYKMVITLLLMGMILCSGIQEYNTIYLEEKESNEVLIDTLAVTTSEMKAEDFIVTDNMYIIWTVAKMYYPENESIAFRDFEEVSDINSTYWFVLSEKLDTSFMEEWNARGFDISLIKEDGVLGTYPVTIYKACNSVE